MELGGKTPVVVAPGYPIEHAVQRVLVGKLLNAGQTCIAPDYALVPRAQLGAFVESAKQQAQDMYPAGVDDADYCSIVNTRQYKRLADYIEQARRAGTGIVPVIWRRRKPRGQASLGTGHA